MTNTNQLKENVMISNELGLHARSAAKIAKIAQNSKSNIWITKGNEKVDANSILDILALECCKGTKITISVDDESDIKILKSIVMLIENGFGE